jgi:hypothetical protein
VCGLGVTLNHGWSPRLAPLGQTRPIGMTFAQAGVGVRGDMDKLRFDWPGTILRGASDLSALADGRILHHRPLVTTDLSHGGWSLAREWVGNERQLVDSHLGWS